MMSVARELHVSIFIDTAASRRSRTFPALNKQPSILVFRSHSSNLQPSTNCLLSELFIPQTHHFDHPSVRNTRNHPSTPPQSWGTAPCICITGNTALSKPPIRLLFRPFARRLPLGLRSTYSYHCTRRMATSSSKRPGESAGPFGAGPSSSSSQPPSTQQQQQLVNRLAESRSPYVHLPVVQC